MPDPALHLFGDALGIETDDVDIAVSAQFHAVMELGTVGEAHCLGPDFRSVGGAEDLLTLDHRLERQAPEHLRMGVGVRRRLIAAVPDGGGGLRS